MPGNEEDPAEQLRTGLPRGPRLDRKNTHAPEGSWRFVNRQNGASSGSMLSQNKLTIFRSAIIGKTFLEMRNKQQFYLSEIKHTF